MSDQEQEGERELDAPPSITFEDDDDRETGFRWVDAPGVIFFWLLAIVVFLQFFTRYVLNDSLAWTEEVARYLLILVCFLGSITAVRRGTHIMLEFVIRALPPVASKALAVAAEAITVLFYGTLTWIGLELIQKTRQKMVTLPVPKSWIYAVCVAALAVMTVYSAIWLWRKLRTPADEIRNFFDPTTPVD
jgi:TRAP-type C4-dicarboxylate transport system permease small subunit